MVTQPPEQRLAGRTVLVVDDDRGIRNLLGMGLASEGADVHMAEDGAVALEVVRSTHRFDVIVLDLSMPVMDGRTFYRELRALPCDTPVMLLSAYGGQTARQELGAEAAMDKPFDPFVLGDRVCDLIIGGQMAGQEA
jgi:two-component system OmpR family response regulator